MGFISFPEISVNGIEFSGSLVAEEVFAMICESLSTQPDVCLDTSLVNKK